MEYVLFLHWININILIFNWRSSLHFYFTHKFSHRRVRTEHILAIDQFQQFQRKCLSFATFHSEYFTHFQLDAITFICVIVQIHSMLMTFIRRFFWHFCCIVCVLQWSTCLQRMGSFVSRSLHPYYCVNGKIVMEIDSFSFSFISIEAICSVGPRFGRSSAETSRQHVVATSDSHWYHF